MVFHLVSRWFPALNSVTILGLITVFLSVIVIAIVKRIKFVRLVNKIPGPPSGLAIMGNAATLLVSAEEIFSRILAVVFAWNENTIVRGWAGPFPMFFLFTAEAFEAVLSSSKLLDKSQEYAFLHPWLGTGLLTSTGSKWSTRRKMLTPTFHFKILEDFLHVFNEQSQILVEKLNEAIVKNKKGFDIYPYITRCTLDVICETAMGSKIQAQTYSDGEYVQAVYLMCEILQARTIKPWLRFDFMFQFTSVAAEQRRALKILHGFTNNVIRNKKIERKQTLGMKKEIADPEISNQDDVFISKKRLAFLDLLIEASENGTLLSDADLREEVDTFMFEGHDTTNVAVNWTLLLIGTYPNIQDRVNEELSRVFNDSDRPVTMADLKELKYLECCIKEALRLYPSVPIMGRQLNEDVVVHGYTLPAKTTVLLFTYLLHRNPINFPDPEHFQPERFFEENNRGRHPYAYVPFSAGPRNCIGQKFAMMEEKVILTSIFRNFHVKSLENRDELKLINNVVLRPLNGVQLLLTPKSK